LRHRKTSQKFSILGPPIKISGYASGPNMRSSQIYGHLFSVSSN